MLIFYAVPQSAYCAKIRGAFRFKEIPFTEREPAGGSYQTTEYQNTVAAGSVPAICQGQWVLHDSQAILEYLDEAYDGPALWNSEQRIRASQRALLNYHDSKLAPAVRELVPLVTRAESAERTLQLDLVRDRLFDRLFRLDRLLVDYGWRCTKTGSAADWTIPCTIQTGITLLAFMERKLALPGNLGEWYDAVRGEEVARQEMQTVSTAIGTWLQQQV